VIASGSKREERHAGARLFTAKLMSAAIALSVVVAITHDIGAAALPSNAPEIGFLRLIGQIGNDVFHTPGNQPFADGVTFAPLCGVGPASIMACSRRGS
jgi:hypothetical protein